jgi:hypothetical protein
MPRQQAAQPIASDSQETASLARRLVGRPVIGLAIAAAAAWEGIQSW